ncbi:MAG TPA: hypothetical protein VH877_01275 [Polyangia bacterium]|jgi:hypothetical protein|nr:hypothetical protein [Polyangia bacterium]
MVTDAPPGSEPERPPSPHARRRPPGLLRRFLIPAGAGHDETGHHTYPWYQVLWLTGVDYFSTLGYQPGIAFLAAGVLSPVATLILVVVTLAGALPVYAQVARRSYAGQGSIAMLERLLPGWRGKVFVLTLLGFAATDFIITMTLSAADAAKHAVENPFLHDLLGPHQMGVTCALLVLLTVVFLRGFTEAIGVAVLVGVPYIALNVVVILRGFVELARHPHALSDWRLGLTAHGDVAGLLLAATLIFPKLALGMSGFETGVSVMPLVRGDDDGAQPALPGGRIRNTRRLLFTAAVIMSILLLTSSLVTTTLIPPTAFQPGGKAEGRALAYLAHELLGEFFGTTYDISTIIILWFAGASAMAGMLNLIPRYLPRFGMAPEWARYTRPLVLIILGIDLLVTRVFNADVEAQGGAYATGVLVLMLSAAVAVALSLGREARAAGHRFSGKTLYFWLVTAILGYTLVENVRERPDGVIIASVFIVSILAASGFSRWRRATELRVETLDFIDEESRLLWYSMKGKAVNLVPLRSLDQARRLRKAGVLRQHYRAEGPIVFLHVELADDRSEFVARLRTSVRCENDDFIIEVHGAVAVANTIAWVSEQLDPIALYLELSLRNPLGQALEYLLWGEGETGILVYQILVRYWISTPENDVRPLIFLVSP